MTTSTISSPAGFPKALRSIWEWIKKVPRYTRFSFHFHRAGTAQSYRIPDNERDHDFSPHERRPLAVLAIGEMMVLALGGFDLSVGAIVTLVVLVSSLLLS